MADTTAVTTRPKVTLYWLDKSRSQRIIWLLQECGQKIDFEIKVFKRMSNMLAPPELKKIHPLGKSPVISVETAQMKEPLVIAESGFMTEYCVDYWAQHLAPKRYQEGKEGQIGGESEQWNRYRYYMHYAEGSLMTMMVLALVVDNIENAPLPFFIKPIPRIVAGKVKAQFLNQALDSHFGWLNSQVESSPEGGKYLCGKELTAADIMMSFPLIAGKEKIDKAKYPKLIEYIELLENHEGYLASIKKIEEVSGEKFVTTLR